MRAILALLALGFAGSAVVADEPPKPAVVPARPAIAPGIGIAPGAPVGNPVPVLMIAKLDNGELVTEVQKQVPVQKVVTVTRVVDGQQVQESVTITVFEVVTQQQKQSMKGAKATMGGKAISDKELAEKLAESKAIVASFGPIGEKYKGLFKDDAILIEFPQPAMVQPKVLPAIPPKLLIVPPKG